jgi:flagellar export protein FliJ
MNDERKVRRVEKLLAISRSSERGAQQAFDVARARSDEVQAALVELELAMIARHEAARQRLADGGPDGLGGSYRQGVSKLRRQISRLVARQKAADAQLDDRRAELLATMTRRRAAQIVRERLRDRQDACAARQETRQMDETHAARGPAPVSVWRQDVGSVERQGT